MLVWTPALKASEASNDSDIKFTVPADTLYTIQHIHVELTTTATAGNRQLVVEIQDASDDVLLQIVAGAVQAASLTRHYQFGPSLADLTSFRDTNWLSTPMNDYMLPESFDVRIYDNNAVDAAADDMVAQMLVLETGFKQI